MSRILVTGGSGFVGSNVALELERRGEEVIASDLDVTRQRENLKSFAGQIIQLDTSLPWKVDGPIDYVFHQAALTDPRYSNDEEIYRKNVEGFEQCLRFCEQKSARVIYASTAGLYGNGPTPMKEDQPKEVLTAYGQSKLEMDRMMESWKEKLPIVGLRYFNVFGPRETFKGRPASMLYHLGLQLRETKKVRLFKYGEQVRDHIYVKDVVGANLKAMETKHSGVYNVGTGIGTSFNDLALILGEVLGIPPEIEYFDMPYDPKTYQANTIADTKLASSRLGWTSQWKLVDAVRDYYRFLGWA